MASENVDIVRRAAQAAFRRPRPDFAVMNELFSPDHEWVSMLARLDGDSLRGMEGFREWLTTAEETWGDYEWELEEVSELDPDRVLGAAVFRVRTRRAGVPMQQRLFAVSTVQEGKIVRTETYSSREEALAAGGNLEVVRAIYADWEHGNFAETNWMAPEIVFEIADGPTAGRWVGLAEIRAANREWLNAWRDMRQTIESMRELDGERVLVLHRFYARGRSSGLDVGTLGSKGASLFHLRDGEVVRLVNYFDRATALADLGLAPA